MPKTLILFGAGASSGSDTQGTPPLSSTLFEELARFTREKRGALQTASAPAFLLLLPDSRACR